LALEGLEPCDGKLSCRVLRGVATGNGGRLLGHLLLGPVEMDVKNITYRIDHEGKILLKPPFRIHSNKKAGIKPRLVPSIVF